MNTSSMRNNALIIVLLNLIGLPYCISLEECTDTSNCNSEDIDTDSSVTKSKTTPTCDLYMGKSTIPNAGLGLFSAIEIPRGGK